MASSYYVGQKILNDCWGYECEEERQDSGDFYKFKFTNYAKKEYNSNFVKGETVIVGTI